MTLLCFLVPNAVHNPDIERATFFSPSLSPSLLFSFHLFYIAKMHAGDIAFRGLKLAS